MTTTSKTKSKTTTRASEDAVTINVGVPVDLHRRVRIKCLNEGILLKDAVEASLREWVKA